MSIVTFILTSIDLPTLAILLFITYVLQYYFKYFTRSNPLPGPFPIPIFGNLLQMGLDPQKFANKLQKEYGDICESFIGSERLIWLSRADLADKIVSPSKKSNYFLRGKMGDNLEDLGMTDKGVVFNKNYETWRFNRKFLTQFTMSTTFLKALVSEIQTFFNELEGYWSDMRTNENEPINVDFSSWARRFSTDLTIKTTTAQSAHSMAIYFNTISPKKKANIPDRVLVESEKFIHAVSNLIWLVQICLYLPPFVRHYIPGIKQYNDKLFEKHRWFHSEAGEFIRQRRNEINETPMDQQLKPDILTLLLTYGTSRDTTSKKDDQDTRPLTEEEIRYTMLEVFTGAIDTTSGSLSIMLYHLCTYPHVKQKMIEEIEKYTGKDPYAQLSFNTLEKLHYCEAVIKEVARFKPVIGLMSKLSSQDDEIAGCKWPGGQEFFLNMEGMHKHKANWDEPEIFNPDRFLDENGEIKQKLPFYQFGGGIRICPGRNMALTVLKTFIVLLLKRYDFELTDKDSPLKFIVSLSNEVVDLYIQISPRNVV